MVDVLYPQLSDCPLHQHCLLISLCADAEVAKKACGGSRCLWAGCEMCSAVLAGEGSSIWESMKEWL